MKRIFSFVSIIFVTVLLGFGCTMNGSSSMGKPKVAATIFPVYDLVRIVGGEDIEVSLIVPPGSSPHTYEATPSVIKELQGTSRIFEIGHGIDSWTASITDSIPGVSIVTLDTHVELHAAPESHEDHESQVDHDHGSIDPHYWMDPTNAYIMVDTIVEELAALDPAHTNDFALRAQDFKDELEKKDFEWLKLMSEVTDKNIVTFHDAFGYFANRFGLNIVATFEPFPGREPSPQYLIDLEKEIKKYKVKTLYVEPQLSQESLETFAKDHGLAIATLDPEGLLEHDSYIDMIDYNVKTIVEHQK